jgi:endonuclease YncB( thermonuclease family)
MSPRLPTLLLALCVVSGGAHARTDCRAIDGDTITCGKIHIRIVNVDTPELGAHARCPAEAELAERARRFTAEQLAGSKVEIRPDPKRPHDRYGRTLARVTVDGIDLGEALVAAGLAREWDGRRRPWCR